jgi:regulator of RNase E activity RraA
MFLVHIREKGTPVQIHGMTVYEGDLIHADRHGDVNIPIDVLQDPGAALDRLLASEAIVLSQLKAGPVDFEKFAALWSQFEKART